ncbi:hypothetical protein GGR50DRAFT_668282 [Xylaria sp. CBS 124048]|nr:hypothetical protein GGR50DRAFT_668282 [Xylaria sp. CBS 124048]
MWILENEGEALGHKRLWLRPGKRYLFGRTVAEPGQIAIQGPGTERVSRKHVAITVDAVEEGHAEVVEKRSKVTVEDIGSKGGTKVNGQKYHKESCVLPGDSNTLQMGSFPPVFRITWFPVVLSFSFTSNQLRTNPFARLRPTLEQLDIKFISEYDTRHTTHVVSKKRNTPKGLQALINGKYIVNDSFIDAIVDAASPVPPSSDNATATSALEKDFDASWPDPMRFLPLPGEEPVPRQPEAFAPNPVRAQLFDGYTFVFYEEKQFESLLAPITSGKGKALLNVAVAGETQIDDFVRYVKGVAGEKGLGEFEDGSEGKGVVVVKWMPNSEENVDWFAEFFRSISLRLDHRLVDQKEFLDAILSNDASGLRRPLEFESPAGPPSGEQSMEVDSVEQTTSQSRAPIARRRGRQPVKSRFRGFAVALDDGDGPDEVPAMSVGLEETTTPNVEPSQGFSQGLFVTQRDEIETGPDDANAVNSLPERSQRKRPASPVPKTEDIMAHFAPTAAQVKRRRIAAGEEPVPRHRASPPILQKPNNPQPPPKTKEIDVLDLARQHREEAEQRAKVEREELEGEPGDIDLTQIRRLHIEEPMPLRQLPPARTREQDIADGRWNPEWNGRKNFKKFRQRGTLQGRPIQKIIVALEEVKLKAFGIGDDYWLEDNPGQRRNKSQNDRSQTPIHSHKSAAKAAVEKYLEPPDSSEDGDENAEVEDADDDDNVDDDVTMLSSSTRTTKTSASTTRSQSQRITQVTSDSIQSNRRTGKRPAAGPPAKDKPAKRAKGPGLEAADNDSDDDELRFRFGKRRG